MVIVQMHVLEMVHVGFKALASVIKEALERIVVFEFVLLLCHLLPSRIV